MTFVAILAKGETTPIPVQVLVRLMVLTPDNTATLRSCEKGSQRNHLLRQGSPAFLGPQRHPGGQHTVQVTTRPAPVTQVQDVNVYTLALHFRCFISESTELEPIRY